MSLRGQKKKKKKKKKKINNNNNHKDQQDNGGIMKKEKTFQVSKFRVFCKKKSFLTRFTESTECLTTLKVDK